LFQAQYLILPLNSAAILIINNAFLWWKGDVHMLLSEDQWHCVVIGLLFSLFFGWGWRLFGDWQAAWLEVSVFCGVGVCCWWAGIHRPAAAAACQSFFYDFYKKLTELSANNFRLLFCWLVS
jgi:hypothetical protein